MSGLFPCSCETVNTRRLASTWHGGDAGYGQSFFHVSREARRVVVELFVSRRVGSCWTESGLVNSKQGEVALQQLEFWVVGECGESERETREDDLWPEELARGREVDPC